MHIIMTSKKQNNIKDLFNKEFDFVSTVLSQVKLPLRVEDSDSEESECNEKRKKPILASDAINRAQSLDELHTRLAAIREKKYTYRGKIIKNKLQNKIKRKKKINEKFKKEKYLIQNEKKTEEKNPIVNGKAKLIFNKVDFLGEKTGISTKTNTNTKDALKVLKSKQQLYKELEKSGEADKAHQLKTQEAWTNVLAKAEGAKVKDNVELLKKTVARKERQKKISKTKWDERAQLLEKNKKEKQDKRTNNLLKRKQDKKEKIKKKAIKKGRYIPGIN
ncbi:surfeit locus protein 6 homolog [Daktulosphaira vitifoliae]|uniref:surfeit locus protein 6 homolog n=1 Tax=Daktulosphaira vitifoliae TaxID=58002 RepID=UPI0021A99FD2|nr:surfeit locus protein 6 homolog [Daktulosphaira vitifoliae]